MPRGVSLLDSRCKSFQFGLNLFIPRSKKKSSKNDWFKLVIDGLGNVKTFLMYFDKVEIPFGKVSIYKDIKCSLKRVARNSFPCDLSSAGLRKYRLLFVAFSIPFLVTTHWSIFFLFLSKLTRWKYDYWYPLELAASLGCCDNNLGWYHCQRRLRKVSLSEDSNV